MAKKEESSKPVLERNYNIPLRQETLKVPNFQKANKAIKTIKIFISKHMKSKEVAVGKYLNLEVWKHGAKNPPHLVKVTAVKDDKGKVVVELVGAPKEAPKVDDKKKPAKKDEKVIKEAEFRETKEEKLEEEVKEAKEEKAEEGKKIEKEELKELQKEHPKHHAPKMPQQPKQQIVHPTAPKSV